MSYTRPSKLPGWLIPAKLIILLIGLASIIASCGGGGGGGNETPVNIAPTANAGTAQTVIAPTTVILDGSTSSDSDGSISSFSWAQISGTNVTLNDATTAFANFTAPGGNTTLIFRLSVTDDDGTTAAATVSITTISASAGPFTLSGNILAPQVVSNDSDTNDTLALYVPNDTPGQAQIISNPITLGGYINKAGTGESGRSQISGDPDDYYRVELLAGQVITMLVADFQTGSNDLDLYLYDSTGQTVIDFSVATGEIESVSVPANGEYLINPFAFSGASNYVLVIGDPVITGSSGNLDAANDFIPGQVIIRYKTDLARNQNKTINSIPVQEGFHLRAGAPDRPMLLELDTSAASQATAKHVGHSAGTKGAGFQNIEMRAKWATLMAIKALRKNPTIAYAEPNYIVQATAIPNDEFYAAQWHYPLINLPAAWELTTGDPGVIVAVIDTGVLLNHPDLDGQLVAGYDFISDITNAGDGDGIDPNPDDPGDGGGNQPSSYHGTHVSGTIAAASNNGIGTAGVAWNSKIMPLRVLGLLGGSAYDVAQAVLYAAGLPNDSGTVPPQPADIINLSLGGGSPSQASQDAYTAARNAGVIIVAAAGNSSSSQLFYPASYTGIISVSAVDLERQLAPYSNFGTKIDVAAPGGDARFDRNGDGFADGVLSTGGDDSTQPVSYVYPFFQGTSMASPHIAGVIALMKSVNNNLTPNMIDQQLALGALTDDIGIPGRDNSFGHGLINAQKAVVTALDLIGELPPVDNPTLGATSTTLNFNTTTTAIKISLLNTGTGNLQLTSITPGNTWLNVTPVNIDNNNLGSYRVTVDRSSLPDGIYLGQITAQSNVNTINISVIMTVGDFGSGGDVGFVYLLLIDNNTGSLVEQLTPRPVNGVYSFTFFNVPAGNYRLIAGTDADNDIFICDAGEACGAYITLNDPIQLDVVSDLLNLDFPIGYSVALQTITPTDDAEKTTSIGQPRAQKPQSKAVSR